MACQTPKTIDVKQVERGNIVYPKVIENEVLKTYRHYPELRNNPIYFRFATDFGPSFMQAQPVVSSLLKNKGKREYIIRMRPYLYIDGDSVSVTAVPKQVLEGWLAHELGHLIDYRERSSINLLWLGIRYSLSQSAVLTAEEQADLYAMEHGLTDEIIATKTFILKDRNFPDWYQKRIRKYYLTPEDIREIAREKGYAFEDTVSQS